MVNFSLETMEQSITITGGGIIIFRYFQGQQMNREEWLYIDGCTEESVQMDWPN
jgi:hypothetical protein